MKPLIAPHSVAPLKLPTLFAELSSNLSTAPKSFIDCAGCENVGAPDSVIEVLSAAIRKHPELIWDHWNPQDENIRRKIARLHSVDLEQVFITSGAIAGIDYCFRIFSRPGVNVGLRKPDWPGFLHYSEFYRGKTHILENFVFPFHMEADAITQFVGEHGIELMVMANPVPVQGHIIEEKDIAQMCQKCPETLFVIDEADTLSPEKQIPHLTRNYRNLICLGSLSKFYGLSGLRIGYLICPPEYSSHFRNTINVLEVSSLAILAGNLVLDDRSYQDTTQRNVRKSIEVFESALQSSVYQIAASPHCFGAYLYSTKINPTHTLKNHGVKILEGQYFGLPEAVYGGRFNLSNPKNAELAAQLLH